MDENLRAIWDAMRDQFPGVDQPVEQPEAAGLVMTWYAKEDPTRPHETCQPVSVRVARGVRQAMNESPGRRQEIAMRAADTVKWAMRRYADDRRASFAFIIEVGAEALDRQA